MDALKLTWFLAGAVFAVVMIGSSVFGMFWDEIMDSLDEQKYMDEDDQ